MNLFVIYSLAHWLTINLKIEVKPFIKKNSIWFLHSITTINVQCRIVLLFITIVCHQEKMIFFLSRDKKNIRTNVAIELKGGPGGGDKALVTGPLKIKLFLRLPLAIMIFYCTIRFNTISFYERSSSINVCVL